MKKQLLTIVILLFGVTCAQSQPLNTWFRTTDLGVLTNNVPVDRYNALTSVVGNKIYYGMGSCSADTALHDFWQYDFLTNTWARKADFPGINNGRTATSVLVGTFSWPAPDNNNLAMFSLNGKVYVKDSLHFYLFDSTSNSWVLKANFSSSSRISAGFAIGTKGYILNDSALFEYDDISDTWTYKTLAPSGANAIYGRQTTIPVIGSKAYFQCYEQVAGFAGAPTQGPEVYDQSTNTWTNLTSRRIGSIPCFGLVSGITSSYSNFDVAVAIGNRVQIIGGQGSIFGTTGTGGIHAEYKENIDIMHSPAPFCLTKFPDTICAGGFAIALNGKAMAGGMNSINSTTVISRFDGNPYYLYDTLSNSWSILGNLRPTIGRTNTVSFVINDTIYVGYKSKFWRLDTITQQWHKIADLPMILSGRPVAFSIGNYGYVGGGSTNLFWKYNPATDNWTTISPFPGGALSGSVAFSVGSYAYVGTGFNGVHYSNSFYNYNPTLNTWSSVAAFPGGPRKNASCFTIALKGYVGCGLDSIGAKKDFWEYDPIGNVWTSKSNFLGGYTNQAVGFSVSNKGFIATGEIGALSYSGTSSMYVYDNITDSWSPSVAFSGGARINSFGVGIGNTAYLGTGTDYTTSSAQNDVWKFIYCPTPSVGSITGMTSGADTVCIGSTITLTDTSVGGTWSSALGLTTLAGGVVTGMTAGLDSVYYSVSNSCGTAQAYKLIYVKSCPTGLNNINQTNSFTIQPNPTTKTITITSFESINTVVITNMIGQTLYSGNYSSKQVEVDMAEIPTGVYLVKINNGRAYKVLKQ